MKEILKLLQSKHNEVELEVDNGISKLLYVVNEIQVNLNIGDLYSCFAITANVGKLPIDPNDHK